MVEMKYTPTTCPYCGTGCGFNLVTVDGHLVGAEPWKRNPVNEGKVCPKGNFSFEFVEREDRLRTPLIKENGEFREASWEEALSLIVEKLGEIKAESPDKLAFLSSARCTNEDNYLMQKFARQVIGTQNVDHCARLCHGPTVAGLAKSFGSGAMTNSIRDIADSTCIFIIGSNTLEQHPLIGRRVIQAKEKGAKIIVADPRYTATSKLADIYLPLTSGSNIALLNTMMNVIIEEGLEDEEFIKNREETIQRLTTDVDILTEKFNSLKEDFLKINEECDSRIHEETNRFNLEKEPVEEEIKTKEVKLISLENEINRLKNIKDVCPTCGQKLPNVQKPDYSQQQSEWEGLDIDVQKLRKKMSSIKEVHSSEEKKIYEEYKSIKENNSILRDEVDCEMICDGLHVSLPMIKLYLKVKDHDQLMMVSDNVIYANLPVGRYKGFDEKSDRAFINITEEGFVLSDTGRLSGSSKSVLYGIGNLVEKLGVPMEECCKFFCYNPIRKYSDPTRKGALNIGKDADLVVISDDYKAIATYSEGRIVYDANTYEDIYKTSFINERKIA